MMQGKKLLTILFFILPLTIFAQRVKISGTVSDFDNKPMDYVMVAHKGTINATFTNTKGQYQITVSKGDSITLVFSALGYQKAERTLVPQADMNFNIMMRENTELAEVVVETEKKQQDAIQNISVGNTVFRADPTGGSVEALIKAGGLGVSSKDETSSQYSVRGGNYDENIVYVNGIEIYRPLLIRSGQQEGLSFINPDMTGNIGFSSGGYDAMYGDKMSSVLDITYKRPKSFEASASTSLLGASAHIGSSNNKYSQITGVRYKSAKSLLGTMDTDAEYDPTFLDAQTYITYNIARNWEASFLGNYSKNTFKFTPQTRETKFGTMANALNFNVYFDGWEDDKFVTAFGAFSLKGKIGENTEIGLRTSAFSSDEQVRYDIGGEYKLTDASLDTDGGQGDSGNFLGVGNYQEHARNKLESDVMTIGHFGSTKIDKHLLKWGFNLQKEDILDKISEWEKRDSSGYSLPQTGEIVSVFSNLKSNNKISSTRFSGYLQDSYKIILDDNRLITLNVGVRGSYWSFNKEFIFSPRASVAYIPSNNLVLRFATGVYYQAPFFKEFQKTETDANGNAYIVLNDQIKSQRSLHFVAGGDYTFKALDRNRKFKFTSEIYYKSLSNLVPYTVDNVKIRYTGENKGKGYIMGLDTKLFGEFVEGTDSWIGFSLMKGQQTVDGISMPLPTDQRYNVTLFFQDYLPGKERLKMSLQGFFSQGLPVSAPNSGFDKGFFRAPAYKRLDIGFFWELLGENYDIRRRSAFAGTFKNVWLGVDIFNLFDIKNTNSYYWVTDIFSTQYAVPNYLTGRMLNFKIAAEF